MDYQNSWKLHYFYSNQQGNVQLDTQAKSYNCTQWNQLQQQRTILNNNNKNAQQTHKIIRNKSLIRKLCIPHDELLTCYQ